MSFPNQNSSQLDAQMMAAQQEMEYKVELFNKYVSEVDLGRNSFPPPPSTYIADAI